MAKQSRSYSKRTHNHTDLDASVPQWSEDDLIQNLEGVDDALLLVLDCIEDPHNLGACLRTADGAGVTAVISPKDKNVPLTDTAKSISCGGAENIPFVQVTNLARTLKKLKEMNYWVVGTSDAKEQSIYDVDLKGKIVIAMGAEGKGLRRLTMENCDFLVNIPMQGKVDCLNVSVAAGVCLYEAVRQRNIAVQ